MILQGDNVICAAETGSGKTLAYLIPLVHKLILDKEADIERSATNFRLNSPRALILVPSRELAQQVYDVLVKLLAFTNINPQVIIGGERTQQKLNNPTYGVVDVTISTPGIFSKLMTNRLQDVSSVKVVVIDEADTLVDDSFSQVIRRIMTNVGVQGGGEEGSAMFSKGAQLVLVGRL
jgi:ATP-dependent RNA helicase DDX28